MANPFLDSTPFLKEKIEENPYYSLTKEDIEKIAEEISFSESFEHLGNPFLNTARAFDRPVFSASPIYEALKLNTSLKTLDLTYWHSTIFSTVIAEVIMLNNTLTHLNLSGHRFGSEIMNAVRMNSTIQTLDLLNCWCDNKLIENTRGSNPNLTSLNIKGNDFPFGHVAEWLKHSPSVTSLSLDGSQLGGTAKDAFCKWTLKCSTLTELSLFGVGHYFRGLGGCLKTHGKLQRFTFRDAYYRTVEEGLSVLESLSFNKDLHFLDLTHSFGNEAYSAPIGRLMNDLPLLTELNLQHNRLDHNISDGLRQNSTLTTLNLNHCFRDVNDMVKVSEALHNHPTLTCLNFSCLTSACEGGFLIIGKLLQTTIPLRVLCFDHQCTNNTGIDDLAETLKNNHTLTFLSLSSNLCDDKGALALAESLHVNTTLTQLDLRSNNIRDNGMKAIAQSLKKNTSLKSIDLSYNEMNQIGLDSILQMLSVNTTLIELKIVRSISVKPKQQTAIRKKHGGRLVMM